MKSGSKSSLVVIPLDIDMLVERVLRPESVKVDVREALVLTEEIPRRDDALRHVL